MQGYVALLAHVINVTSPGQIVPMMKFLAGVPTEHARPTVKFPSLEKRVHVMPGGLF